MPAANNGYIYCVSWFWINSPSDSVSNEIYRFYADSYEEFPDRYSFKSAIIPRTSIINGKLTVSPQVIHPEDLDKKQQAVYIFKVPRQVWTNGPTYLPVATSEQQPSKSFVKLSEELLTLISNQDA